MTTERDRPRSRSRRIWMWAPALAIPLAATAGVLATYVALDPRETEVYASLQEEAMRLEGRLEAAERREADAQAEITSLADELTLMGDQLEDAQTHADMADERAEAAEAEAAELRLAYDPAIQTALQQLQATALALACTATEEALAADEALPTPEDIIREAIGTLAGIPTERAHAVLDPTAISAEIEACAARAQLTADKADGFYLVGSEIAPGSWRALGSASCMWERRSGTTGAEGEVIARGFGVSGQIVTISSSDVAFSSARCGRWTYLGP